MGFLRTSTVTLVLVSFSACASAGARTNDPQKILAEADHLAMLYNWPKAAPLYKQAGEDFTRIGDKKGELSARLGWIRSRGRDGSVAGAYTRGRKRITEPYCGR